MDNRLNIICENEKELDMIQNYFLNRNYSWVLIVEKYYKGNKLDWSEMFVYKQLYGIRGIYVLKNKNKIGWFAVTNKTQYDNIIEAKTFLRQIKLNKING